MNNRFAKRSGERMKHPAWQEREPDALNATGISVHFDGLAALSEVDIVIRKNETLGLIGPNGAGKTTLVNVLTGFQRPDSGRVLLGGTDVTGWPPQKLSRLGIARTFQAGRLFQELTVIENVEVTVVAGGLPRKAARAWARELLAWFDLLKLSDAAACTLPYAEERKVGIARALASNPQFVLLDEPAAGMSESECDQLIQTIARIPERFSAGMLLIEHNLRVVMGACGQVQVLDGGRTVGKGLLKDVLALPAVSSAYLGIRSGTFAQSC